MRRELVSRSACSLFRRAGVQVWFEEARGLGQRLYASGPDA